MPADARDPRALMADALVRLAEARERIRALEDERRGEIAIVGLGLRLPGRPGEADCADPDAFWRLLEAGGDCARPVPADRWDAERFRSDDSDDPGAPGTIVARAASFLEDPRRFDAAFFGIAPREAEAMDPQQALLLETAWRALEHAGIPADALRGSRTGVFVGISTADWSIELVRRLPFERLLAHTGTGTNHSVAAGRVAYALGLTGPCLAVDTACSSSLVALHLACESLRRGECDAALCSGVNAMLSPATAMVFSNARMLSRDGRCRTFDAAASGYGRGEGCVTLALKRLADARRDGDRVLACVLGAAVNQDGASGGITVPNGPAQQAVIRAALAAAGVGPDAISYLEAHGTGTPLGDPIELGALAAVFAGRPRDRRLPVGSVKTNLGHAEAAAGLAGVLKVVLQLEHGTIAPHLHLERPTPHVDWDRLPLEIPTRPVPWRAEARRVAGVSSFGFSGTNAHVVLAEPPADATPAAPAGPAPRERVLALSARDPGALDALARAWVDHLRALPDDAGTLDAACATAALGRARFPYRLGVAGRSRAALADALERALLGEDDPAAARGEAHGRLDEAAAPAGRDADAGGAAARAREAARAFARGAPVAWDAVLGADAVRRRATVPGHPLRRERCLALLTDDVREPLVFHAWRWIDAPPPPPAPAGARVAVEGESALAAEAREALAAQGARLVARDRAEVVVLVLDAPEEAEEAAGAERLLGLVHELAAGAAPPRVALLARDDPRNAPAVGFARAAALEHPELGLRRVQVAGAAPISAALAADLLGTGGEDDVLWADGARRAGRIEPLAPRAAASARAGGTWLVTGGLGALGRRIAARLLERGAARVVLAGRRARAVPPELAGAAVEARACDVADPAACAALVASLADLRGVVHAAGVLDDGVVRELTPERLSAVLRPKLAGAWNLHRATAARAELEHFVLISSSAALLGSPGQASYVAANLGLDALARLRRRAGLPALAVHFGPWAGEGMAAAPAAARRLAALGLRPLPASRALSALETLLAGSSEPAPAFFELDAAALARATPPSARPRRLERLLAAVAEDGEPRLAAALLADPPELRLARLEDYVARALARVLRIAPGEPGELAALDRGRPFVELGLDSLMAIELRNRVQADLGVTPPMAAVQGAPSVAAFAETLLALAREAGLPRDLEDALAADEGLLAEIEALGDEEAERLLGGEPPA